ncbi:MAG: tetratricopeptide repeat protein [Sandaracinus sp.]
MTSSALRSALALVVLGLSLLAPAARAQDAEAFTPDEEAARAHFRIGQAQYEAGQYTAAATEFETAYGLSHRPELFYNVYVSYREIGDLDRASAALRRYLDSVPDAANAAQLRARLAAMDEQLAQRAAQDAARTQEAETDPDAHDDAAHEAPPPSAPAATQPSPIGFAVLGVGAAALVASAVTGGLALSTYGSLEQRCGADHLCPPGYESDRDAGLALSTATDVLWGVGGAALVTGLVLVFVLQDPVAEAPAASASCGPTGCGVSFRLHF